MKKICALIALLLMVMVLLPSVGLPAGSVQGEKEGIAIFKEADELRMKARSKEDKERALAKYEQALEIFRRAGSKWQGPTLNNIALVYRDTSQYQQALEYFEKALELQGKVGNAKEEATTLANIGGVYTKLGQYQKALEYQEKALELHRKISNPQGEAWALYGIGYTYQVMGQYQKSLEYYENALAISRKLQNTRDEGSVLTSIGYVYGWIGEYQKALDDFQKGLEIHKKTANVQGEGYAMGGIGTLYHQLGQYQKALDYRERALAIQKRLGNEGEEGIELNNIATSYSSLGQYQKALENYEKALEIYRKVGAVKEEGTTLSNVGRIYFCLGQYQKALEYCNKALAIQKGIGASQGEIWSSGLLGNICHASGQRHKALENYERACELARTIGDQKSESANFSSIGRVCFGYGKYDDALKNYQRALELQNRIGTPTKSIRALIAWTYMEKNELDKAEETLNEMTAAVPVDKVEGFAEEMSLNWAFGKLRLMKGEFEDAKIKYNKLLDLAGKSGDINASFTAYTGLGKVYEGLEDYEKAEEYYEKGMKLTEEIRSGLLPSERKDFFEVRVNGFDRSEPAKGLTRVRMKLNQAAGSIDSSEVTRARAFSDNISLRSETGYSGVPKEILQKEDELVTKVAAFKKELQKTEKDKFSEKHENLTKQIQGAEQEMKVFVGMLWDKYKAYASVKYPRPVTLKESSLRPEECVIVFDISDEGVGVKLIKGKEIGETAYKKWRLSDLEKDVKRFRQSFEQANLENFDAALAEALYKNLLLRVLVDVPEGTPLVIIPDGILAVLPFEALVVSGKPTWKEEGNGPYPEGLTYLGSVYPISYYQSITAMTLARTLRSKEKTGAKTLVIADPVFEPDDARFENVSAKEKQKTLTSLPGKLMSIKDQTGITFPRLSKTAELAESLKKLNPGKTDTLTGMQAKKSVLFDQTLAGYASIVFATHGYFGTDIPGIREPILTMTLVDQPKDQDGFLRMTEVMGMKLNADVVALTACQTGLGSNLSGEGVLSMGRAFQYAGAKSVLMSLWSVSEVGSVKLVESFFKNLKDGKNKLDALKLAREEIRKDGYEHPFFWAPFILVGEVN